MTNEEVLDRLGSLINKCFSSDALDVDDAAEVTTLFTELRSRLTEPEATEITITSRIKGSPEVVGIAIAQFIQDNAEPECVDRLLDRINAQTGQRESISH